MFKKILATGLSAFFALHVFASSDDIYAPDIPQVWGSIITVSGGPAWASPGKDQYLYPYPRPMYNYYAANSKMSVLGTGELFFGLQHLLGASNVLGQLGLGVAAASNATISGVVDVNGVPDVYSYSYKVSHVRIELKGKLIANGFNIVQPYVSASLGGAFNHSHDYLPTTVDPVLYPTYWFDTNSTFDFSYTLGLGVQRMLNPNWQVGVGYEFASWGKSSLGRSGTLLGQGLVLPNLYTNELLFSLSYLF